MTSNEIHFATACGHEAVVKPVRKAGGKFEGKWICRIKGPKINNPNGIKTTFSGPIRAAAQERIAIKLGLPTSQVILQDHEAAARKSNASPGPRLSRLLAQPDQGTLRNEQGIAPSSSSLSTHIASMRLHQTTEVAKSTTVNETSQADEGTTEDTTTKARAKKRRTQSEPNAIVSLRAGLRESLRRMRSKYAKEKQVPPYFIINNLALDEIVTKLPLNEAELLTIHGIGPHKAKEHSCWIFDAIRREMQPMMESQVFKSVSEDTIEGEGTTSRYFDG